MTDTTAASPQDEQDLLAAEYAIGLLDGAERDAARDVYDRDPDFAAAVAAWQRRLGPLFRDVAGHDAPAALWPRIIDATQAAPARLVRHLNAWRAAAIGATAIAAALATVLVLRPGTSPVPVPAPVVAARPAAATFAQLATPEGKVVLDAHYDVENGFVRVRATDIDGARKAPELWVIAKGGAPRSLGLISATGETRVPVSTAARALLQSGATLAVTMEDIATAPHDAPTGAILASGTIARL